MATKRITISLPVDTARRIAAGPARSVSEWVAGAVARELEEEDLRRRFLEFCEETSATPAELADVDAAFARITKGKRGRGKTAATGLPTGVFTLRYFVDSGMIGSGSTFGIAQRLR